MESAGQKKRRAKSNDKKRGSLSATWDSPVATSVDSVVRGVAKSIVKDKDALPPLSPNTSTSSSSNGGTVSSLSIPYRRRKSISPSGRKNSIVNKEELYGGLSPRKRDDGGKGGDGDEPTDGLSRARRFRRRGRSMSTSSFLLDEDSVLLYQQIRQAFLTTGTLMMGGGAIVLGYYNYIMLESYVIPFFWAVTFSVVLRKPRSRILLFLHGLTQIERKMQNKTYLQKLKAKALFFAHPKIGVNLMYAFGMIAGMLLTCGYFGYWLSSPMLFFVILPTILLIVVLLCCILMPSSYHTTFVAAVLLLGVIITVCLSVHFFTLKSVEEATQVVKHLQKFFVKAINDPSWIRTMSEYGLTQDQLKQQIENAQNYVITFLAEKGIDVHEITTELGLLGNSTFANNTFSLNANGTILSPASVQDTLFSLSHSASASNVYTMLGNLETQQLTAQLKNWSSFIFGTVGIGIISLFGRLGSSVFNLIAGSVVFLASLYYLLMWDASVVDKLVDVLPIVPEKKRAIAHSLLKSVKSIFVCSFLLSLTHGVATYILFSIYGLPLSICASILVSLTSIFPFIPAILIYAIAAAALYVQQDPYVLHFIIGTVIAQVGLSYMDAYIFTYIPRSHPFLTGMAVVLGVSTFGIEGIVLGPLLIVVTITAYELFTPDSMPRPSHATAATV